MADPTTQAFEQAREVPASFTALFDKGIGRTKDAHDKMTAVMEHMTESFKESFSCANRGSAEYRAKMMEIARANANAAFDLAHAAMSAKSPTELFELSSTHARKQFDLTAAQAKELTELAQKVMSETTEPIRSGISQPLKMAS